MLGRMMNTMKTDAIQKVDNRTQIPQMAMLQENFSAAFQLVDDVVLKNYITKLTQLPVIPLKDETIDRNLGKIRLFKITEMVYGENESATYKFASVFNAVAATQSAIVTIISSNGIKTDFYLGIRSLSDENSTQTSYASLVNAMKGQFPGTSMKNLKNKEIEDLLQSIETGTISAVSCVANNKNREFIANDEYLQGLEKLALAMQGSKYTAIIIANSTSQSELNSIREKYEQIYTQLSPYANTMVSYGANSSTTSSEAKTESTQFSESVGTTHTKGENYSQSQNIGEVVSKTKQSWGSVALTLVGAALGAGIPKIGVLAGAGIGGLIGSAACGSTTRTSGGGSKSYSKEKATSRSQMTSEGTSYSTSYSSGSMLGENQNIQLTIENKSLIDMLDRIDKQLERISEFESIGMWECAAYFLSTDPSISKVAAATYKALMSGEHSGLERSAINTWIQSPEFLKGGISQNEQIARYIKNFIHPLFLYSLNDNKIPVMPTNLVSGNELAIHMGLPRHSVCGFPVIEHADFGKEVVRYGNKVSDETISLGNIFNMGREVKEGAVSLNINDLAMHTFITGATGVGKSNTIYTILDHLMVKCGDDLHFMVIEPAKGEYKNVFGHRKDVSVLGTNPYFTKLLKINPFKFPKGIHVLEHVDRLIEIFNVCWPMYAAMPAVLKEAVLSAYRACGWNLTASRNMMKENLYPTFKDLLEQLRIVVGHSAYSNEVKANYLGSLLTRVQSLTNGLNGQIFSSDELGDEQLFDKNVIADLSRIGSQETKALIMGILVMRLTEYRMSSKAGANQRLQHITVLEEAHNILGHSVSGNSGEGSNIAQKSVEMLSNAIAEVRTYGEGFIIADQSPGAVDISAIRNTNTKIIMRLPEEQDRRAAGKAAALDEEQIEEIAKLPRGVAIVYQNDWVEPVLCKVEQFIPVSSKTGDSFKEASFEEECLHRGICMNKIINFILYRKLPMKEPIQCDLLEQLIGKSNLSAKLQLKLYSMVNEYKLTNNLQLWNKENWSEQSQLVAEVLGLTGAVEELDEIYSNFIEFRCQLNTLISEKLNEVNDQLLLIISNCLIDDYRRKSPAGIRLYTQWEKEVYNWK